MSSKNKNNKKPLILYVDDEEKNLSSFKSMFRRQYDVYLACSGHEGLDILNNHPIQIVIADQRMPKMTGAEFLTEVANQYPKTLRLMLTGYSELQALVDAVNFGKIHGYFSKPLDGNLLTSRIDQLMETVHLREENKSLFHQLKMSEEQFRSTFEQAAVGIAHVHPQTNQFQRVNQRICDILGYHSLELLEKTVIDITHPDYIMADQEYMEKLLSGEIKNFSWEKQYIKKDSSVMWGKVTVSMVRDQMNRPKYSIVVLQDISDQKKSEEERNRLFNYSIDMLCVAGFDGYFKQINPAWEKTLGWSPQELMSQPWIDFVHTGDRKASLQARAKLKKGKSVLGFENRYRCKDGTYRWLEWNSFPLRDENLIFAVTRDITKSKMAEEKIRRLNDELEKRVRHRTRELESEKNFSDTVINSLPGIFYAYNEKGKFLRWNKNYMELTGFTDQVMHKKYPLDPVAAKYKRRLNRAMQKLADKGSMKPVEADIIDRNGKPIPHLILGFRLKMNNEICYLGIGMDITELKKAREISKMDEERLEALLKLTQMKGVRDDDIKQYALEECVKITRSQVGYFHYLNENEMNTHLFSWSENVETQCKVISDHKYPIEKAGIWADSIRIRAPMIHNDYQEIENRKGYPEEHIPIKRHMSIPIFDNDKIIAIIGVGNKEKPYDQTDVRQLSLFMNTLWNIIKQRQAEGKLNKLSLAVEQSPATVVITNREGTIEYVNPKFTEITGYTRDEAIGKNPRILKAGDKPESFYRDLWETINNGKEWHGEFCNKKKDGEIFWESASISPIRDEAGDITHFVAVKEDITEKKRAAEELRNAKESAEAATHAKSDFLAKMSHEIRTPMNAILGMAYLLKQTKLTEKQQDYLNKIHISGESLLGIIDDILDFSKIEAGKLAFECIDFNLNDVLDRLSNLMFIKMQERGLEFILKVEQDVPIYLKGDPLRLGQILTNLTNNAFKFTEKGRVFVNIKRLNQERNTVVLEFSIQDTGIGMSKQELSKLFCSFSQADVSTTRKYGGSGLGLAISKAMVEQMKGEMWVQSEKNKGSCFFFSAQFEIQTQKNKKYEIKEDGLKNMRVLVVDDIKMSRYVLTRYLKNFSFKVESAESGEAALKKICLAQKQKAGPFKLVLLDWKLPVQNGLQVIKEIKENLKISIKPKIIMVTAYRKKDLKESALKNNVDAFLTKPISKSTLWDTIVSVFREGLNKNQEFDKEEEKAEPCRQGIQGSRVLLVEDNEINRQVAIELLEKQGLAVTVATNGTEAVDILSRSQQLDSDSFDLVLMDLQMPEMDGYQATRKIRSNIHLKHLPILAMTADAVSGIRQKTIEAGMSDYVTKPINPDQLFDVLYKWLAPFEKRKLNHQNVESQCEELEIALNDIDQLNIKAALSRLSGNQQLYLKLLEKFYQGYGNFQQKLETFLKNEDYEESKRMVHTLKGTAGNIGAEKLMEALREFEKSLIHHPIDHVKITQLKRELFLILDKVLLVIQCYKNTVLLKNGNNKEKKQLKKELNIHQIKKKIETLKTLLKEYNSEAKGVAEEISEFFPKGCAKGIIEKLIKEVEGYEFENALKILNTLNSEVDFETPIKGDD